MPNPQNEPIKFHKEWNEWGELSNYYPAKIRVRIPTLLNANGEVEKYLLIEELEFSTSEALFHALKFTQEGKENKGIIKKISGLGPDDAKKKAETHNNNGYNLTHWWYNGWNDKAGGYCIRAMKWVVREKFKQNPKLLKKLLETGKRKIIENTAEATSYNDEFWGNGNGMTFRGRKAKYLKGEGENQLGKILMEVRTEFQEEKQKETPPEPKEEENVNARDLDQFAKWIKGKLSEKGLKITELDREFQDWQKNLTNFKKPEIDGYKKKIKAEIERVAKKKKKKAKAWVRPKFWQTEYHWRD